MVNENFLRAVAREWENQLPAEERESRASKREAIELRAAAEAEVRKMLELDSHNNVTIA